MGAAHSLSRPSSPRYEARTLQATVRVSTDGRRLREDFPTLWTGPGQLRFPSQPSVDAAITSGLCDILFVSSGQCAPSCRFSSTWQRAQETISLLVTEGAATGYGMGEPRRHYAT